MDVNSLIGKIVLSSKFGIGTIVGVDDLGMSDKQFFVIESHQNRVKNFLPVDDDAHYRLVSSQEKFKEVFDDLKQSSQLPDFQSKQERINFFKDESKKQEIDLIASLVKMLRDIEDKGSIEIQIFDRLIESLSMEYSIIYKTELEESKTLIEAQVS